MAWSRATLAKTALWGAAAMASAFYLGLLAESAASSASVPPLRPLTPRRPLPGGHAPRTTPRVSVIVPARDEERNIEDCVASLLAQDYDNFEVIVVDDGSTDATPAILARLARTPEGRRLLRVARVETLPPGWAGKPHALHTGALVASGEWLLFTDADTRHMPTALRSAVARALSERADLFTIGTNQDLPGFWNRALMPIAYMGISAQYPPVLVNNPRIPLAIANGQFLLIRRAMYDRVGGYGTDELRATVVDDLALARVVKRAGGRLRFVDGRGLVSVRMYASLREHMNGWGKNAAIGSHGGRWLAPFFVLGLPLITVWPFVSLVVGLLRREPTMAASGATATAAALAYRAWLDGQLGVPRRYGLTLPLGGAVFTYIIARSYWRTLRGATLPWRGRSYAA
ncbi:MAG TPA: glycosyltransferase [Ktedonobacterales bacterium]